MVPNCLFSVVVVTHCVFFLMLFNVLMDLNYIVTVFHIETTVSVVLLACHCTEPPPTSPCVLRRCFMVLQAGCYYTALLQINGSFFFHLVL